LINGFADMVNQFKNHPAIFAWVFGNELNSWTQNHDGLWNMINIAKITAHNVEGGLYHPFTTAVADMTNIGDYIKSYDYAVDFWALQVYRGNSFKDLFDVFAERSSKPMIISEFGIDAWNANTNSEDQASQAQWLSSLYGEILARKDVCSGGVVFSFADEWWKSGGDPNVHTTNGYGCASYDGTCNEGWYGLCSVAPGTPNVVTPRQAYYTIQNMMKSQTAFQ
jgi:endo-1,4-beta-mannosidase